MYGQYYQQDPNSAYAQAHGGGRGQQGYWSQFRHRGRDNSSGSGSFTDSPFTSSNPFSMYAAAQRARVVPPGALLLRGLVAYLILSSIFLVAYRSYRDWRHEDGWRMSESLARHEQMEEMHRIRQEMNERARLLLQRGGDDAAAATALYGSRQHVGESPEARALEYARQRRIQMMQEQQESATAAAPELRGWPRIDEDKGRIIRRAQDPPGVVFFEPRKEDTRRRQIDNQRRGSGFVRRGTSEASGAGADGTAAAATAATAASAPPPPPSPLTSPSSSSGVSLPPEVNVGSIVATPVGSEQEAQAVMRNIFGGLRKSAS
ncbi:hypothetical protein NESM_000240900 [Novymonas esmeraldas]|uniref:Transmembrane protein n=1 Tax=Novymonas esmeraldas TaxID=1808958 RepID=A0AAW0F6B9_9TRYP